MRTSRLVGVALLFAVALGACGGGLSHTAYVKKVNAICDKFNTSQKDLAQPTSAAQIPGYVDAVFPVFQDETKELSAVKPPQADKATVDAMLSELRAALPQLQKLKSAVTNKDAEAFAAAGRELQRLETSVNTRAKAIGLTTCAQG
jgi:hypothetical protein